MDLSERIKEIIEEYGVWYRENSRTIYTTCPRCNRDDKFSILKANGACICYRGSCDFGKQWFTDWIAETADITAKEAKTKFYGSADKNNEWAKIGQDDVVSSLAKVWDEPEDTVESLPLPTELQYPEWDMIRIVSPEAAEAARYLENRGIPVELAAQHRVTYSVSRRRVILPIIIDGKVYGWQGRAIDPVDKKDRMRNNLGFRRDQLVMFVDNLKLKDFAIVCEGPFDALKFNKVGGFCCTMGKVITKTQKSYIFKHNIKKLYIALDEDAPLEIQDLMLTSPVPTYIIKIPQSCRDRCELSNKKADFGECTFEECEQAFRDAKLSTLDDIPVYLKFGEE